MSAAEIPQERLGMKLLGTLVRKMPGGQNKTMARVLCSCGKTFVTAMSLWRNHKVDKCSACAKRNARRGWY